MDIQRGQMFCVNSLGSEILELLDKGCNETQIADQVSAAFGADVVSVRADVRDFLDVLRRHKILRTHDAAGTRSAGATHGT